ncbi:MULTISPECIES: homoserine dehydrogenase [Methylobacterium]|jgi:homoserine dehydrogenase|uniref:Homoserine dehydrogenase n=1 Tax=Methylobacterium brachiatum TaxID=269660 RepID=A0AAJ1TIU4_9HYPH|nr:MULTISPECIES: homoserine dehydrogenase [Methylobacterium]EIZ85115.1 homoserine dehydrogenase [Methylobacterium sp. GXF4]MCB4800443.1 homoserine dehydrogenase [Methylobacterium brachiatum]MDH2312033.1 homoserine dehydrogenase [Methylobacterium brachiatum]MDQ0541805.1 homoserine dehydrogenase [Methylobacterium brachiatum]CAA2160482.1 Homoserine dehydrogenase [Methylobacterium brachiatum]
MTVSYRIGVAGLGTVGASVVRMIARRRDTLTASGLDIRVAAVSSRDRSRDRGLDLAGVTWFDDPVALARSGEVDCVVELIGGAEGPAKAVVEAALQAGKTVVTANKALLARHGAALAALAEANGVALAYEAAVAGGIPVIKTLREGLPGNAVARVYGILNGTCNYILSRMEREGLTFEACLKDAQALGYAEADPTFDVEGFDTAHKLAILTSLAYGTAIDADGVSVEGISRVQPLDLRMADELGYRIKLLGVAQASEAGIEQRVHPTMVPKSSAIAQVMGVTNAVTIDADAVGELTLIGPGAGGEATASAVVADIADVARGIVRPTFGVPAAAMRASERVEMQRHEGGYYIRLTVHDRPGVAAGVAQRMAEREISLESILQRRTEGAGSDPRGRSGRPVPLVLITYAATEGSIRAALDAIGADGLLAEPPQVIRIERE